MRADIGGSNLLIAHLPRRHAKAHLFSMSGRGMLAAAVALALMVGLGLITQKANSAPSASTPYSWIGR